MLSLPGFETFILPFFFCSKTDVLFNLDSFFRRFFVCICVYVCAAHTLFNSSILFYLLTLSFIPDHLHLDVEQLI